MKYYQEIILKDGRACCLRNGTQQDGQTALDNFNLTHEETDYLLTYPEENCLGVDQESNFLQEKAESENEVEILAIVDGRVAGTAGIEAVGNKFKLRHRAEFGISVAKEFWGVGIGQALTRACIECAEKAGYKQIELNVVAENVPAISLYEKVGFQEFGRNPKGFYSKTGQYQTLVHMRLEL